ncbi:MAG: mannitol-1-phosphate 5-dehydrogenase, partial [Candidatus Hydrogenedentes bacterium]|nr:mannitol-1-phosphate 5-dehydrogenase [Candidatus Hydrogenedentota bacterium]
MKKAVHFGAGNIGRGFLGQLYFESGYETTFVDVADALIAGLNERRAYPLRILDEVSYTMLIENVRAVDARKT